MGGANINKEKSFQVHYESRVVFEIWESFWLRMSLNYVVENDYVNYVIGSWSHFYEVGGLNLVGYALLE